MQTINPYETSSQTTAGLPVWGASNVRWKVLAFSIAMAVLLYLDRFALNAVQPVVMESLSISKTQMGWITSAFFWAYALAQVPAGTLGDFLGGRRTLTLYVVLWSVAFGLQAVALGFLTFVLFRVLQGIAQAGAYAVTARFLKEWIEPQRRGRANSAVSMGGRIGGATTYILTPALVAGLGWLLYQWNFSSDAEAMPWRPIFLLYAALGLVWAIAFYAWFRDRPEQHPAVTPLELEIIRGGGELKEVPQAPPPPWIALGNRNLWLLSSIMMLVNVGWIFLATWQTTYLSEVHKSSSVGAGGFTALTALGGIVGCLAGGFATDWLVSRLGIVWGRRLPGLIACGGAGSMYVVSQFFDTAQGMALAFACVFFWNDFLLGALWSAVQDVGGRNSGAMFGFINMSGNLGAAMFSPVIGMLAEGRRWDIVFIASASAFFVATLLWFFVDPRVKLPE